MATFTYIALDKSGNRSSGTIPADSRTAAMDAVIRKGLSPLTIEEQASANAKLPSVGSGAEPPTKVPRKAVEAFTRELANLLAGGLSLSRGLALLKREASHPAAKYVWQEIHDDVIGGDSLADAMAKWPKVFSTVYVAMIRAGEAGGFVHVVLQQIADFRQREQDLKGRVKAALIYPAALAFVATGVLIFLLTFFIPKFESIFSQFGEKLPALTQVVVAVSGWLTNYGLFIGGGLVALIIALKKYSETPAGIRMIERAILRVPALGTVIGIFALVRFCRMLGTLVHSGVPLVNSLKVAREALGNHNLSDTVTHAIEEVQRGTPLHTALSSNKMLFPPAVIEMISVAEETGRLDDELLRLSVAYEGDLDRHLRILVALAEPALLLVMAGLIGTVVVSMLLPLFTLQDMIN